MDVELDALEETAVMKIAIGCVGGNADIPIRCIDNYMRRLV